MADKDKPIPVFASWKTTAAGAVTLLISVLSLFVLPWLHGEPVSLAAVLTKENIDAAIGIAVGIGLILSRDANKSSEDSGVKTPADPVVTQETADAIASRFGEK